MFNLNSSTSKPGGLFGSATTQQPQQQVSQFGTTLTNNNNQNTSGQTGGLFGSTNNNNPSGGLFGNTNTTNTTGGLFGNTNNTPATNTTTGGLFGAKPATTTTGTGGLFGNNNNNNTNSLFGNNTNTTSSLFGQQQQSQNQQQQQQQQSQFQPELLSTTRQRKLIVEQPRILPSWTRLSDNNKQPPREVIKRLTNFGTDDDSNFNNSDESDSDIEFEEDIFGNVGFGKNSKNGSKRMINKRNLSALDIDSNKDTTLNTNNNNDMNDNNDFPPSKSLFDIEKEMEIGYKIQQSRSNPSVITEQLTRNIKEDSKDFKNLNIFDRSDNIKENQNKIATLNNDESDNSEVYSCIVFGYPENISTQILTHFNKFGTILEDFPFLTNNITSSNKKKLPIETGDSWCKITYANKVSYQRALKENGTLYSGYVIGCVPYTTTSANKNNINNNTLNTNNVESIQHGSNITGLTGIESKNLNNGLLVADIFQKGGVITSMDTAMKNQKENGKLSGKLNELLFGFNSGNI
ncbi:MPPN-domain-containing protein [Hanseniaspora valbyensis NRRL Y-1626]|uniref:MPPN-domain-containing protein n=1 Tax=Hanseniaspora valbyensis NRRL Y-1626 TaxID=766949 RepID=A0A1B7TDL9_9ASCO|nr:MPPN-domain-containing protein [Hanseniaspora valbyensis NRRL Y-1626]